MDAPEGFDWDVLLNDKRAWDAHVDEIARERGTKAIFAVTLTVLTTLVFLIGVALAAKTVFANDIISGAAIGAMSAVVGVLAFKAFRRIDNVKRLPAQIELIDTHWSCQLRRPVAEALGCEVGFSDSDALLTTLDTKKHKVRMPLTIDGLNKAVLISWSAPDADESVQVGS